MAKKPRDPFEVVFPMVWERSPEEIRAALDRAAIAALPTDPRLLFEAMRHARAEVVELFLSLGADPNAVQDDTIALLYNPSAGVTKALLDAGAKLEGLEAPLLAACGTDIETIQLLLDRGLDPALLHGIDLQGVFEDLPFLAFLNKFEVDLGTALVMAVVNSPAAHVKALLALEGKRRWTVSPLLCHAVSRESRPLLRGLLAAGSSVHERDDNGNTPLHGVSIQQTPAMARALLRAGARVDAVNKEGWTPLMALCQWSFASLKVAKVLIDAGASLSKKDKQGRNALTLARLQGMTSLAALLRKRGAKDQRAFAAAVATAEAEHAEKARITAANKARALASFERVNGKSGTGKLVSGQFAGIDGHAARLSGKQVAIWIPRHYSPNVVLTEPAESWVFDAGQDPGAPPKKRRKAPLSAEEIIAQVEVRALEGGVTLGPGLTEAQIEKAERALETTFSAPFRLWLLRHGSTQEVPVDFANDLLSLDHLVEQGLQIIEMAPMVEELGWGWGPGLVPFAHDGAGDYDSLDLRVGTSTSGKVLRVWHDSAPVVVAPSFLAWLDSRFWGSAN